MIISVWFSSRSTQQYSSEGSGSGIIVGENDDELLIATNNHVVSGATTLSVCFMGDDVVSAEQEAAETASDSTGDVKVEVLSVPRSREQMRQTIWR